MKKIIFILFIFFNITSAQTKLKGFPAAELNIYKNIYTHTSTPNNTNPFVNALIQIFTGGILNPSNSDLYFTYCSYWSG